MFTGDYLWLESYVNNDSLWFEDVLNWDDALLLTNYEFLPPLSTIFAHFVSVEFYENLVVKFAPLDAILITDVSSTWYAHELYMMLMIDLLFSSRSRISILSYLFYSGYQDSLALFLTFSPELVLGFDEFVTNFWVNSVFMFEVGNSWDVFSDTNLLVMSELLINFVYFWVFVWFIILFSYFFNLTQVSNPLDIGYSRYILYINSLSRESRVQIEAAFHLFVIVFLYLMMALATFDDSSEETTELANLSFFSYFLILLVYLVFKYSIHYFAFLEASDIRGRSVSFVVKQFFRDIMGSIGLFLRFFILLFRLNVYDNLDDFFDSYYIFVGDFDDDEYGNELFLSPSVLLFFEIDGGDDSDFLLEDDIDMFPDLFMLYFLSWSKLFLFLAFILEEVFRVALALYISYIIIFEIHASNYSYSEESSFASKLN